MSAAWGPSEVPTTALLTDHYELTMVRAALRAGNANRRCVFELFARRLPEGRRYGVVAGVGRALRALGHFRFDEESLRFLLDREVVDQGMADWLADFRSRGDIWGYPEGEIYFPGSPIVIVESTFGEAVVLETLLLSIYNHDSAIASAASRMTAMAGDRPSSKWAPAGHMSCRLWQPRGPRTSQAFRRPRTWRRGGVTECRHAAQSAHSFTLLHATSRKRSRHRSPSWVEGTTLLVDTYDVFEAVKIGVELTEGRLGAVRLDSGDLGLLATPGPRAAGLARCDPNQDHCDQRPRRVHPRRARREHRSTATGSARHWSPAAATPRASSSTSWWRVAESDEAGVTDGGRGQEEREQDLRRWSQVRPATAVRGG